MTKSNELRKIAKGIVAAYPRGMAEFAKDEKAKIYKATGDGRSVEAQSTDKEWDDGAPITKYFTRGGYKSVKLPKGNFYIIETPKWWYSKIGKFWVAINRSKYGTPPFEY